MKRILTLLLVLVLSLSVFVACDNETPDEQGTTPPPNGETNGGEQSQPDEDLQAAYDYIKLTYKTLSATTADFELMKNAPIGDKIFAITWSVDNAAITITESDESDFYVVHVPALGETAINYVLKFSVQNDKGEKKEGSFNLTVPTLKINTFEEYAAAEDGELLIVEGIVTGVISVSKGTSSAENSIYLQDVNGNGGYYAYSLATDPAESGIEVGMTVRVSGNKKTYNGNYELVSPQVTIIDETITPVTPVDFTETFAGAASTEAPELVGKNGMLVKLSGVTLLEYNEDKGYHNFQLGNHKTYLRISSSANCITKEEGKAITKLFEEKFYNGADVVGIITIYNGAFYLIPVSAEPFTNFVEQEIPSDIKVDIAMDEIKVPGFVQVAGNTKLPTTFANFSDLTVAWELVDAANLTGITLNGNVLNVTIPEEPKTITLKGSFTVGDCTKTKEYNVTVKGIDTVTIKEADDMVAGFVKNQYTDEMFYVIGTIQQITSTTYGNMYIVATIDGAEYGIEIYGMYDENNKKYGEFEGYKPQVGDTVKVRTVIGKYTNSQLKNAVLVEYNHNYDAGVVTPPTCSSEGYTTYTCACGHSYVDENSIVPKGDHYYGEGVTDTTDMVCTGCGVKNHEHTTVAGTVVPPSCTANGYTVYTCSDDACAYTENKDEQPKLSHNDTDGDFLCDAPGCDEVALPAADSVLTIEQAIALGNAIGAGNYTTGKYYVTGTIQEVYNETYGNMYIVDANGTKYCVYGTYTADGAVRYDKMTVKPAVDDTITVYGIIGSYGTTLQMKNGWIQHSNTEVVTAPTCTAEGYTTYTCKFCGATSTGATVPALGHNFVDGVCDRPGCGALNHEHNYTPVVTPPTCTAEGYTTKTCTCGDVQKVDIVPALNHNYTDGVCANGCGIDDPDYYFAMSIEDALKAPEGKKVILTGIISDIKSSWSTQYNNMEAWLSDGEGNQILLYRIKTQVAVGDKVTVQGTIGVYKEVNQIAQSGSTVTITEKHTCTEYTDATCQKLAACVVCGATKGELAGHSYVEGVCSVCGLQEGSTAEILPENLTFASAANKANADDYMKTNYSNWTVTGTLGQTYAGYLGFGRSGDKTSSIKSTTISVSSEFTVTTVLKGNGSNGVATSTLTFTLVDAQGNVIATGYANDSTTAEITPVDAKDTTYNITFTFVEGKTWTDVSNLVISFAKSTGNIGLKSLEFVK